MQELGLSPKVTRAQSIRAVQQALDTCCCSVESTTAEAPDFGSGELGLVEDTRSGVDTEMRELRQLQRQRIDKAEVSREGSPELAPSSSMRRVRSKIKTRVVRSRVSVDETAPSITELIKGRQGGGDAKPAVASVDGHAPVMARALARIDESFKASTRASIEAMRDEVNSLRAANEALQITSVGREARVQALSQELAEMRGRLAKVPQSDPVPPSPKIEPAAGGGGAEEFAYSKPTSLFSYCMEEIGKPDLTALEIGRVFLLLFILTAAQYVMVFAFFDAVFWEANVGRKYAAYKEAVEIHNFYVRAKPSMW